MATASPIPTFQALAAASGSPSPRQLLAHADLLGSWRLEVRRALSNRHLVTVASELASAFGFDRSALEALGIPVDLLDCFPDWRHGSRVPFRPAGTGLTIAPAGAGVPLDTIRLQLSPTPGLRFACAAPLRDALVSFDPATRFVVIVEPGADLDALARLVDRFSRGARSRVRFVPMACATVFAQDNALATRDAQGRPVLLVPRAFRAGESRAEDALDPDEAERALGLPVRRSRLHWEGGNVVHDVTSSFVGVDTLAENAARLGLVAGETMRILSAELGVPIAALGRLEQSTFDPIGHRSVSSGQASFHVDLDVALLGRFGRARRPRALVADAARGLDFVDDVLARRGRVEGHFLPARDIRRHVRAEYRRVRVGAPPASSRVRRHAREARLQRDRRARPPHRHEDGRLQAREPRLRLLQRDPWPARQAPRRLSLRLRYSTARCRRRGAHAPRRSRARGGVERRCRFGADVAAGRVALLLRIAMTDELNDPIDSAVQLHAAALDAFGAGALDRAAALAGESLALFEQESGLFHPDVANVLNCLARIEEQRADPAAAEAFGRRSVDIMRRVRQEMRGDLGDAGAGDKPGNADIDRLSVQSLTGLGDILRIRGRYDDAEPWLREAIALGETSLGTDDEDVVTAVNSLAVLFKYSGRFDDAAGLYQRALAAAERTGASDESLATLLHNIGGLEHARGDYARGEPAARRSVELRERALGPNHPTVAADVAALAAISTDSDGTTKRKRCICARSARSSACMGRTTMRSRSI